jgi:hypothetical protein
MFVKRINELAAIVLVGDGLLAVVQPRRRTVLWRDGPRPYRAAMDILLRRPLLTRFLAEAEVELGLWLASRQRSR